MKTLNHKLFLIIVFISLFPLINIPSDFYVYSTPGDRDITYCDEYVNAKREEESNYQGQVTKGPYLYLKAGQYQIDVSYQSSSDENYVIVYSASQWGEASLGKELAFGLLSADNEQLTIPLFLDNAVNDIEILLFIESDELSIDSIIIQSQFMYFTDSILFSILLFVLLLSFYLIYRQYGLDKFRYAIIIFLISIVATIPMLNDFLYNSHDLPFHLTRIEAVTRSLQTGNIPSRISPVFANEIGYASSIMYPEIFLYLPSLFRLLGMSMLNTYKLFIFCINISTATISYFSVKRLLSSKSLGIIYSAVYSLCIYRLVDLYVRGSIGEVLAMIFIPMLIWAVYEVFHRAYRFWPMLTIAVSGIIQSHIITTLLIALFLLIYLLVNWKILKDKPRAFALSKAVFSTLLLNAWFIVPFLYFSQLPFNIMEQSTYTSDTGAYFLQLFASHMTAYNAYWNYPSGRTKDEMTFSLGIFIGLGILAFIFLRFLYEKSIVRSIYAKISLSCLLYGGIALLMASNYFPWHIVLLLPVIGGALENIQYVWRFLTIAAPLLSVVASVGVFFAVYLLFKKRQIATYMCLILCLLASSYFIDSTLQNNVALKNNVTLYNKNELYNGQYYYNHTDVDDLLNNTNYFKASDGIHILNYTKVGTNITIEYENVLEESTEAYIEVPLYHYPGYRAQDQDGNDLVIIGGYHNLIKVMLPESTHNRLYIRYKGLPSFHVANIVSLITFAFLISLRIWHILRKYGVLAGSKQARRSGS